MIQVGRLSKLHGTARARKCALLLERIELDLAEGGRVDPARRAGRTTELLSYARDLARFLVESPESEPELADAASAGLRALDATLDPSTTFRAIDDLRHYLMRISGQAPADWDLHDFRTPLVGTPASQISGESVPARPFFPGVKVYLEDIRSPFNVGTIMRTAEALGFEEVLLSPACADPRHPRALRSSMGTVDLIPWRRCPLGELPAQGPLFALELGGLALEDFHFPERGVLILGSEELGVSAPALALSSGGRVSIPMRGIKASINVAVAFGIAAHAWVSAF